MATSSGAAGSLSIVIPAYNEAARIGDSLRAVCDYVTAAEVVLFDPGLRSFRNVNTPEEWEAVRAEWGRE